MKTTLIFIGFSLLILSRSWAVSGADVSTSGGFSGDRQKILLQMMNTSPVDMICSRIEVKTEISKNAYREFVREVSVPLRNVIADSGVTEIEVQPFPLNPSQDEYISRVTLGVAETCWRPATFLEYCSMSAKTGPENLLMKSLFDRYESESCEGLADKIKRKVKLKGGVIHTLQPLMYLPDLKTLRLLEMNVESLKGLEHFSSLEELDLEGSYVDDLSELNQFKGTCLRLDGLRFRQNPRNANIHRELVLKYKGACCW